MVKINILLNFLLLINFWMSSIGSAGLIQGTNPQKQQNLEYKTSVDRSVNC